MSGTFGANLKPAAGLKITAAQREYYRYTGTSAVVERRCIPNPADRDFSRLARQDRAGQAPAEGEQNAARDEQP